MRFALFILLFSSLVIAFLPTANANHTTALGKAALVSAYFTRAAPHSSSLFGVVLSTQPVPYAITMFATLYFASTSCTKDAECQSGYVCSSGSCVQSGTSSSSSSSPPPSISPAPAPSSSPPPAISPLSSPTCSPSCSSPTPYCVNKKCVQCTKDSQCAFGQTCNLTTNSCASAASPAPAPSSSSCLNSSQCAAGQVCTNGTCSSQLNGSASPAPSGNQSVACAGDADCAVGQICSAGSCIAVGGPSPSGIEPQAELPPEEVNNGPPPEEAPVEEVNGAAASGGTAQSSEIQPTYQAPSAEQSAQLVRESTSQCPTGKAFIDNDCYAPRQLLRCSSEIHARGNGVCCAGVWVEGANKCPASAAGAAGIDKNVLIFAGVGGVVVLLMLIGFVVLAFKPKKPGN